VAVDGERLDPHYLNYFLNWDVAQVQLKKLASRSVSQANISASKLRDFAIPIPPTLDEQREISPFSTSSTKKFTSTSARGRFSKNC
jgi:restriction endonuclease S subunit